jgi:hypothetical protein
MDAFWMFFELGKPLMGRSDIHDVLVHTSPESELPAIGRSAG